MPAVLRRTLTLVVTSVALLTSLSLSADAATKPGAPTGLTADTGMSSAVLAWNPASSATHYRVCLLTAKTQTRCGQVSAQLTRPTLRLDGLTERAGTDYYFRVYAYNGSERTGSTLKGFNLRVPLTPDTTTGIKQTVTSSTLTITWSASAHAKSYSICLRGGSTSTRCIRTSPTSSALTAKLTGLTPTGGGDYFYRVTAYNGTASSRSAEHRVDLPVGSVATATVKSGSGGVLAAAWRTATNAETYELQLATNTSMTKGLRRFTLSKASATLKPPIGTTYYYRVRGLNGVVKGSFTRVAGVRLPSDDVKAYVLTYNLCGQDKCVTSSNKMKKWSTRRTYAGRMARDSGADIIATQESHETDTRFGRELPGFGLAAYKSAKSLFYDRVKYDVLRSGTITLDAIEGRYAVWAEFREETSRNTFIVADAHLQPYKGKRQDDLRQAQTKVLLGRISAINAARLPVIYAGDYNSNKSNADQSRYEGGYDAVRKVFVAAGIPDTFSAAANPIHSVFNSANQAINPPLRHADHVDHIYADPRIEVKSWRVMINLSGTRYTTPFATDHNPIRAILRVPGR